MRAFVDAGGGDPLLLDRDPRAGPPLRPRARALRRPGRRRARGRGHHRGGHHARRPSARPARRRERGMTARPTRGTAAASPRAGGRRFARSRGLLIAGRRLRRPPARRRLRQRRAAFSYFDVSASWRRRRHAGARRHGPDHRHPDRRLRPLAPGRCVSLVNVVLASRMDPTTDGVAGRAGRSSASRIGGLVGAFNGFFIAVLRLQPIVVTLSTMFILQGITLLVMDKPGGMIAPSLGAFYLGDAIPGVAADADRRHPGRRCCSGLAQGHALRHGALRDRQRRRRRRGAGHERHR